MSKQPQADQTPKDFASLGLSAQIVKAVEQHGYHQPTPIQAQAIPAVLTGRDLMAAAQTGTGKTAGFTLPILEKLLNTNRAKPNQATVLMLTPTRELAAQVHDSVVTYGKYSHLKSTVVFGGVKINPQMKKLRSGVDILVATPGRLLDLHNQNAVKFNHLEILVLDEADRMLDMGFIHDIRKIIALLPKKRQTLMFSATFSQDIVNLAKTLVNKPIEISVNPKNTTVEAISQKVFPVDKKKKSALLAYLIKKYDWSQVLVFTKTKHGANRLVKFLENKNISALPIHGNKSQAARTKALDTFKNNKIQVLVATDIAARGIDINLLPHVVNFDLPHVSEDYVHRIGRTGRAGSNGEAVSLVSSDEIKLLKDIERLIKKLIPRTLIDGFEPVHDVPTSQLDTRPIKPKKPKKVRKPGDKTVTQAGKPSKTQKNIRKPLATNKKRKYKSKAKKPGLDPYANYRSKNKKR
jgi:ATP-dependent RNA helicase RhlE